MNPQQREIVSCSPVISELGGRSHRLPQNQIQCDHNVIEYYPEINLNCDIVSVSGSASGFNNRGNDTWQSVLIPVNEGPLKRITRTFFERGFKEALNEARQNQNQAACLTIISKVADWVFQVVEIIERLKCKLLPHEKVQGIYSVAQHAETRDWLNSIVRCIAWHPNCFKIAVAGVDDIIRIYTDEPSIVPVLKSFNQKWITCMAWRPYSAIEFVVGCQKGICLWSLDSNMHMTRSFCQTVLLTHDHHCPISSLAWNNDGALLASASISDTDVLIWNIDKMQNAPLKRVGYACSLLKWSLNGSCLFSSTIDSVFRVWYPHNKWDVERWSIMKGYIQAACWSPCCSFLLFVTSEDSTLYRLQFLEEQPFQNHGHIIPNFMSQIWQTTEDTASKMAMPIANLSKIIVNERELGGRPQSLIWDPLGLFLAITFKDTSSVVIYSTCIYKFNLTISSFGFVVGLHNEYPTYICFQSINHKNQSTVLTIGWSSGRIQYFPLN